MTLEDIRISHLESVRWLLREWVRYRRRWTPQIGYPAAVSWIDRVKGHFDGWTEGEDYDNRIHAAQMRHVDQAVRALAVDLQHAINVIYLNEIGPEVWRSGRKPRSEIVRLCEQAELALVPVLRRRDVI